MADRVTGHDAASHPRPMLSAGSGYKPANHIAHSTSGKENTLQRMHRHGAIVPGMTFPGPRIPPNAVKSTLTGNHNGVRQSSNCIYQMQTYYAVMVR